MTVPLSAVAAQLLDGGRTAHSALKIPFPVDSESAYKIDAKSQLAPDLNETHLIIWDEIVMTHLHNLEAVVPALGDLH